MTTPVRRGPSLVGVPGPAPVRSMPVAPEHISAHQRVVSGPADVPVTGDALVDEAMAALRDLLAHGDDRDDAGVLSGIHERLARRLADATG